MLKKAFAGLELLILTAVIVGIIIIFLAATNIFDQIAKTSDNNTLEIARQLNSSIIRSYGITNSFPWEEEMSGVLFSSSQGLEIINKVVGAGELQKNFVKISGKKLATIFLTTLDENHFTICFKPESKFYATNPMSKFNYIGEEINCKKGDCYICLNDGLGTQNSNGGE